jgi:hypothetical protein
VTANWNNVWTYKICCAVKSWRCGKVIVFGLPGDLFARSWPWSDFKRDLVYKLREIGAQLEWREEDADLKREAVGALLGEGT